MSFEEFRKQALFLFALVIGGILLLLLSKLGFVDPLFSAVNASSNPVRSYGYKVSLNVRDFFETVSKIKDLKAENEELREKILHLQEEKFLLEELERENEILREQLDLDLLDEWELKEAGVVGLENESSGNFIYINRGSHDGIKEEDPVVYGNYAVGLVREVFDRTARVELITSDNVNIPALTQETRAKGLVNGGIKEDLRLTQVFPEQNVEVEDYILTSGINSSFPTGLILGEVVEVSGLEAEMKTAEVKLLVDLDELEKVFIIQEK